MLKITRLEIEDFGRHKKIHHDLEGHVVGLTGPNGKGKSTVLQAIQFALTGGIDHEDALPEFIRKEESPKPPKKATVRLCFEADGKKGSIVRSITPSSNSRELRWDGFEDGKPVSADKKVSEIMFEILGVDKKAINSTVFIKQGEIGKMFGGATDRRDFYIRLMMLGHLTKIADVVDVYRKQVGDSVQDLSAVLDSANEAAEAASDYFETADVELRSMTDYAEEIRVVSELLALFNEQTDAEQALSNVVVSDIPVDAEKQRRDAQDVVSTISQLRKRHMEEVTAHNKATRDLEQARLTHELATTRETKNSELTLIAGQLMAGDPTPKIAAIDQIIAAHNRMAVLPKDIEDARTAAEDADRALVAANAHSKEVSERRQALLDEHAAISSDLKIRKAIQVGMQSEHAHAGDCLVCGSKTPDSSYLTRTIAELEARLAIVVEKGGLIRPEYDAAAAAVQTATRLSVSASNLLDSLNRESTLMRANLLGAPGLDEALAQKADLQRKLESFTVAQSDYNRVKAEIADLDRKLAGRQIHTDAEIAEMEKHLASMGLVLPWDTDLDRKEQEAAATVASLTDAIRRAADSAARLAEANSRVDRVRSALEKKLEEVAGTQGELTDILRERGILTHTEVLSVAESLRLKQDEFHQATGKLSAAREALKAANSKVIEIELRIAEQGERRKLADDLVRLRDTFKPSGVATEYLDYKFGQVARLASEYLAESGADFMVCASNDVPLAYDFMRLDRPGEVWMPQSRMSGGQRVRLAVATLRAIHALIMPNVGLMVLDEPTTHLDDDAVRSMAEMLRGIGSEGSLQMIVCDHNPVLIDAFSDTIDLS